MPRPKKHARTRGTHQLQPLLPLLRAVDASGADLIYPGGVQCQPGVAAKVPDAVPVATGNFAATDSAFDGPDLVDAAHFEEVELVQDWLRTGYYKVGVHVLFADADGQEVHILVPAAHADGLLAEVAAKSHHGYGKVAPFGVVAVRNIAFRDGVRSVSCCENPLCDPKRSAPRQELLQTADWTQLSSDAVRGSVLGGAEWLCACAGAALSAAGSSALSQAWVQEQALLLLGALWTDSLRLCPTAMLLSLGLGAQFCTAGRGGVQHRSCPASKHV